MSWFGGGNSRKEDEEDKGFLETGSSFDSLPSSSHSSLGGGGLSEFQEFSVNLQQQMLLQQVITELADRAFLKCVTSTKESRLAGREVACIHAATNKWLDCNEYLLTRLAKKQQQATSSSF